MARPLVTHAVATAIVSLLSAAAPVAAPIARHAAPTVAAAEASAVQDLARVHAAALAKARELAAWADERKLYSGRTAMHELVLAFDPDDAEARKALGFRKQKGEWIPGKRKEPADECEADVPAAFAELRRAALVDLVAQLDAALADAPKSTRTEALRRAELARLVPFDDASAVRERLGEVWDAEAARWILVETRDARAARAAMATRVADLRAALPTPEPTERDEHTRAMTGLDFTAVLGARGVVATSTLDAAETGDLLLTALLMRDVFLSAFPAQGAPGYPTVLYCLEPGQRGAFLEQHPLCPKEELAYRTGVTSSWLTGRLLVGATSPLMRKDVTAFQTAGYALTEKFGVWTDDGWAQQGLTSYLAFQVTGTRLSFWDIQNKDQYGEKKLDAKNWHERVPPSTQGWLLEASGLVAGGQSMAHFARALTSHTVAMSWEDVVTSHAVAAYLFEAKRDVLVRVLLRTKEGAPVVATLEEELGMPLEELRTRLVRWIAEMEPPAPVEEAPKGGKRGGAGGAPKGGGA